MTPAHKLKSGIEAIAAAIKDGVKYSVIEAGAEPPHSLPSRAIFHIDDITNLGPQGFKVDGLLDAAFAIYLIEEGHPFEGHLVAKMARDGVFLLVNTGPSLRLWFNHIAKLGLLEKTLVQTISGDPRRPAQ